MKPMNHITTVEAYIDQIPEIWKPLVKDVRSALMKYIQKGFVETLRWGMITYEVPIEVSGPTYNSQPLMYIALAAQKHYCSLYLTALYIDPEKRTMLESAFIRKGLKANMGKSCIRFKRIEDLPLAEILSMIHVISVEDFLKQVDRIHDTK